MQGLERLHEKAKGWSSSRGRTEEEKEGADEGAGSPLRVSTPEEPPDRLRDEFLLEEALIGPRLSCDKDCLVVENGGPAKTTTEIREVRGNKDLIPPPPLYLRRGPDHEVVVVIAVITLVFDFFVKETEVFIKYPL